MTRYAMLCLLLLCAPSMVNAREVRMHGANGDGGACPEATAAAAVTTTSATRHAPSAVNRGKTKVPTFFRGGDEDTGSHTPRWHSFLPGMFR